VRFKKVLHLFFCPFCLEYCNSKPIKAEGRGGTGSAGKQNLHFLPVTNMKLVFAIALLAAPFAVSADRITYDRVYSNGSQSLATVACSDGDNGMLRRGFKTFEDLPTFPDIGGSSKIEGWNSFNCGSPHFTEFDLVMDAQHSWLTL